MKVQAKHGKVTQNMHGASINYIYVWDVSTFLLDIISWRDAITGDAKAGAHKARATDDIGWSRRSPS